MKKNLLIVVILTCLSHIVSAQTGSDGIGFSSWIKDPIDGFSEQNTKSVTVKIDQIIARNSAGATSALSVVFAIYPEFIITREDVVKTGMKNIYVINAELTLFAVNKADMSNYGSVTIALKGNGNSKSQCIGSMLNTIRPTNPALARFVFAARDKIAEYYTKSMPQIMTKVNSMVTRGKYDEALVMLALIPESVADYDMVATKMSSIYMHSADKKALDYINKAKVLIIQKEYDAALEELLNVDPLCAEFKSAEKLVAQITSKLDEAEQQELETSLKVYNDNKALYEKANKSQVKLEKMRIESSKAAAIEQAKTQAKKAESSGDSGLSAWYSSLVND